MSDHNIVIGTFNLITSRTRKPQRKIPKFNRTDWTAVRKAAADVTTSYMTRQPNNHIVEENGTLIETHILSLIEKHIPTKMSKSKQTYPWITPEIKKKLQRKRDGYYIKAIKSKSPDHGRSFHQIRKQCKKQITNSHQAHLQTIFGDSLKENPKPFWSYIKSLRKYNKGILTQQTPTGTSAATDTNQSFNQSINQSINKSINQSIKKINQSINQTT